MKEKLPSLGHLVRHLVQTNWEEILAKSLLNCHAVNVHSIMLLNAPGKVIRLFVAEPGHNLHANMPGSPMSVGFHAHHCDLTLVPIRGTVVNWTIRLSELPINKSLWAFKYTSAITTGKASFTRVGEVRYETLMRQEVRVEESVFMEANEIHTIYVPENEYAAWMVFEGREDAAYDSLSYTNTDLERFDFAPLYIKPTYTQIVRLLAISGLI